MSWQEAERQTGISAKTGELLVRDGGEDVKTVTVINTTPEVIIQTQLPQYSQ